MKHFAIILAGCGVYDGSEIHEATLSMYAIAKEGHSYQVFAPDINQHHVINHITGEEMDETRNVLIEASRIARGNILPLSEFKAANFDGLLFPGGFGVAKNLSNWAFKGVDSEVNPEVADSINTMIEAKKPIGALCISPVLLAKTLNNVKLTIGDEPSTVHALESIGATHINTQHGEVIVDENYKIVTTPCYMLDASIAQIGEGAKNIVKSMINLM